ncbi:UNVERIFIED_CONTAM: Kinesin-like protein KIN-14I [Sesamum radiatum]|uniref:Kinesin-like protein KIN-14I n=1 Tax=Sesamum radiatum TaxID=300843 RepID=A0AAW2W6U0_SESRA
MILFAGGLNGIGEFWSEFGMAAIEGALSFSAASVVEDVLQQHGNRSRDLDFDARRAEEAAIRRYEAATWLRKMVGVVGAKDLPAEPSEEEFRLGLRSGIILCNVLNKIQNGAVQKVVESPCDPALIPDGAALTAYQYFENVRNFLVAAQEMGLPTFEASDLEQGGKSSRVVNCVLALKSYNEWKQTGGNGVWKFGGNVKTTTSGKQFVRKNSEPFTSSLSRTMSSNEKSFNGVCTDKDANRTPLSMLVRAILLDKKPEDVPNLVESVLSKVVEEFEHHIASQVESKKASSRDSNISHGSKTMVKPSSPSVQLLKQTLSTAKAGMQFMQVKFHEEIHNLGLHIHGLAHAASGYHRVLEENRKLYNQVQDLKGNIRVYCRVRPFLPGQCSYLSTVDHIEEGTITINTSTKNGKGRKSFNFNKVFGPSATQEEVFSDTRPLVRSVLDGYNVCIFAYGQRIRKDLHYEIHYGFERSSLKVSFTKHTLEIRNSSHTGLSVPDASLVHVSSTSDVIDLMNLGQRNRAVGATALNDRSSRSHSCLTVHVQGRDLTSGNILRGCMHLVDLAGSERVDKSEVTGDRLKEAQHINKSLSALGDVISSLAQKNSHVPYRNSKLTQLLQDSLGGQAKTLMFVHISPEPDAVGETISTLKFAERVASVELGAARINKDTADVKELREQVASLKAALARKDGEPVSIHQKVSGSPCNMQTSPFQAISNARNVGLLSPNGLRKPMEDVGNIEVHTNPSLRQKKQSLDLDELLGNSPTWPPVSSPCPTSGDDDREVGSGDWVDKLMDQLDAGTSDSSEPDLLWQFNHNKLGSFNNGIGPKVEKPHVKQTKSPEFRSMIPKLGPSPSRKAVNGAGQGHHSSHRIGRQTTEIKRKTGIRK